MFTSALWADKWTFEKKSTLFFEISSLPIFSLCLPHLHNEIRDIFLSVQDNTQNEIFVFEVGGLDTEDSLISYKRLYRWKQEMRENR